MQKYSEGTRSSSIIPKALRCDASKVTLFEKLGEGAFAQVFRAEIDFGSRNGGKKPVAFKQMKESAMTGLEQGALEAELQIQAPLSQFIELLPNFLFVGHEKRAFLLPEPGPRV